MVSTDDECPAHFSIVARQAVDRLYPNRWIGRGSQIRWPARSPDPLISTCGDVLKRLSINRDQPQGTT